MKKHYFIYALLSLTITYSCDDYDTISEIQTHSFVKYFGNPLNSYVGKDVIPTSEGYAVLGSYEIEKLKRIFFVLTDKYGNITHKPQLYDELINLEANRMVQDPEDGSFYITGTQINGVGINAEKDIFVLKLDNTGNKVWSKNFNSDTTKIDGKYAQQSDNIDQEGYDIMFDTDTTLIVAGYSIKSPEAADHKLPFFIQVGKNDSTLYSPPIPKSLPGNGVVQGILAYKDNHYLIGSIHQKIHTSPGIESTFQSVFIARTNSFLMNRPYVPYTVAGNGKIEGNHIMPVTENKFAFIGTEKSLDDVTWRGIYGFVTYINNNPVLYPPDTSFIGTSGRNTGKCIVVDDTGVNFFGELVVTTPDNKTSKNMYVRKTDFDGNVRYTKTYGASDLDQQISRVKKTDDGFIVIGTNGSGTNTTISLIKLDETGEFQ